MPSPEEFERRLKEKADAQRMEPGPEVWEKIVARLDQPRKKRIFFWLFFGGLLLGSGIYFLYSGQEHSGMLTEKPAVPAPVQQSELSREKSEHVPGNERDSAVNKNRETNLTTTASVSSDEKIHSEKPYAERPLTSKINSAALKSSPVKTKKEKPEDEKSTFAIQQNINASTPDRNAATPVKMESHSSADENKSSSTNENTFSIKATDVLIAMMSSIHGTIVPIQPEQILLSPDFLIQSGKALGDTIKKREAGNSSCVKRWLVSISAGKGKANKFITEKDTLRMIDAYRNTYDLVVWSATYHLHFSYCIGNHFRISSGAEIMELAEQMLNRQIVYHYDTIAAGPIGLASFNAALGFASSDTTVESIRNKWTYLQLPFELSYRVLPCSRISLEAGGGISAGRLIYARALVYDFQENKYEKEGAGSDKFQKDIWSWKAAFSVIYSAGKNMEFSVRGEREKIITNIFSNDYTMEEKFNKWNMLLNISYRFGK